MNKLLLGIALCFATLSFAGNNPGEKNHKTVSMTVAEFKAMYGYASVSYENQEALADTELIQVDMNLMPCAEAGMMPCEAALAQARAEAQRLANDCCCVITSGVECCDPSTGTMNAFLFIVTPKGNCN